MTLGGLNLQSLAAADDWNVNANGNWNTASNWLNNTVPNGIGDVADVVHNISGNRSITLDTPITLGTMRLGDTNGGNYFILQGQTLTFDNGGAGAILDHSVGTVTGGPYQNPSSSDRFTMSVILNDDLTIYAGRNIQFYNTWDAQGNDLTINDVGRVYFVGSNGTSSNGRIANVGTINVNAGELRFDGQAGGLVNQVDAQTIELGTGTIVGTRPYARLEWHSVKTRDR